MLESGYFALTAGIDGLNPQPIAAGRDRRKLAGRRASRSRIRAAGKLGLP